MTPEELEILEVLMSIGMSIDEAMSVISNVAPVRQPFDLDPQVAAVLAQMQQGVAGNHPATYTGRIPEPLPEPVINFNPSVLSEMTNGTMFGPWLASGSVDNADGEPWGPRATVFPPSDSDLLASSAMGGDSDVQTWMGDADTGYYAPNSPTGRPEYPMPDKERRTLDLAAALVNRGMQGARQKQSRKPATQPGRATSTPVKTAVQKAKSVAAPAPKPAPRPAPAPARGGAVNKLNKAAPTTSTRGKSR